MGRGGGRWVQFGPSLTSDLEPSFVRVQFEPFVETFLNHYGSLCLNSTMSQTLG